MIRKLPGGYRDRAASRADAKRLTELFNAYATSRVGEAPHDADELLLEWNTPEFDINRDTRVIVSPEGRIVGYGEVWDTHAPHVLVHVWGRVDPDAVGRGIGSWLLEWEEMRAREALLRAPEGARVAIRTGIPECCSESKGLLAESGYTPIREFYRMVIEMDGAPESPTWPAGVSVRVFDRANDLDPMVRAMQDAFSDHWGHVARSFEEERKQWVYWIDSDKDFDPSLFFLAECDGEVAGASFCTAKRPEDADLGWVHMLGVRRPWRHRGIARSLLKHSFATLYERGKTKVGLGVDGASLTGATHLYETAGMRCIRRSVSYERELRPGRDLTTQTLGDANAEEGSHDQ